MPTARSSPSDRFFSSTLIVTVLATPRLPTTKPRPRINQSEPTTPATIESMYPRSSVNDRSSIEYFLATVSSGPRIAAAPPGAAVTRSTSAVSMPNSRLAASRRRCREAPPDV